MNCPICQRPLPDDGKCRGAFTDEQWAELERIGRAMIDKAIRKDPASARDEFAAEYDDKPAGPRERLKRQWRER